MKITVNPDAQASGNYGYAAAGDYVLRVVKCEQKTATYPYLNWSFEFADKSVQAVEAGKQLGSIFEITTLKPEAQFRLRDLCEALGLTWGDFDTDEVIGLEGTAHVKIDEYEGKLKNVIDSWVPKK